MKTLIVGLLILLFTSCGPSEGDYYEHLMTEERAKVEVIDSCSAVVDFYEEQNQKREEEGQSTKIVWPPSEGESTTCVGLDEGSSVDIEYMDYFGANYQKVN